MNIFVTSECPIECAKYLDNKRVVKMVLESAQLLSTALRECGIKYGYKATHINHPCSIWARTNQANFLWLYRHGLALCAEYTRRYSKVHKSEAVIRGSLKYLQALPSGELTEFMNCTEYKSEPVLKAYWLCLNDKWDKDKKEPEWY